MADTDIITQTNQKLLGMFTGVNLGSIIGWLVFIIICAGGAVLFYLYWKDRKESIRRLKL